MRKKWLWMAPLGIIGLALFIVVGGEVVRLLWNWLAPALFGWRQINFWQAVGLLALCRILFGGHGGRGFRGPGPRLKMGRRWQNMTPEERERFRDRWRAHCGPSGPPQSAPMA